MIPTERLINPYPVAAVTALDKVEPEPQSMIARESSHLHEDYIDAKFEVGITGRHID